MCIGTSGRCYQRGLTRAQRRAARSFDAPCVAVPLERATSRFSVRTMLRSPKHCLSLAAYVGTGLALVLRNRLLWFCALTGVETVAGGGDRFLSLPLVISFLLRMRFIYNIPSELSAN